MPEGKYIVTSNRRQQTQTFLPGASYHLECRSNFLLSYEVTKQVSAKGEVTLKLTAQGSGRHHFDIRTDNLSLSTGTKDIDLKPGKVVYFEWTGHITSQDTPWVAVVLPDNNLSQRKEAMGAVWEK